MTLDDRRFSGQLSTSDYITSMVQDTWSREYGSLPPQSWDVARRQSDQRAAEARFPVEHMAPHRPPLDILRTIREEWGLPANRFFLAVSTERGEFLQFSGPDVVTDSSTSRFFNKDQWLREPQRSASGTSMMMTESAYSFGSEYARFTPTPSGSSYARSASYDRRRDAQLDVLEDDTFYRSSRKRPRQHAFRHQPDIAEDNQPAPVASTHKGIRLDNEAELWSFYAQRFKNCQQTACKLMSKAWIKAVEPKKQSNHPYTGAEEKAPDWWPKVSEGGERVRHKEPDHLFKRERVHLLCHILRMVMKPKAEQHPDIQKLNLSVAKLEEVTWDALSNFFTDKETPNNAKKKPYLKEIFQIAKKEERRRNGELDDEYEVYVAADDKVAETYPSDVEDGEAIGKEKEGVQSGGSSKHGVSPQRSHDMLQAPAATDHNPQGPMSGDSFNLPVRDHQYAQQMLASEIPPSTEQHSFVEVPSEPPPPPPHGSLQAGSGMVIPELVSTPMHDGTRRPSQQSFGPATDYAASYTPATWPQGHSSTAQNAPGVYTYNGQQTSSHDHYLPQTAAVPIHQSQSYVNSRAPGMDGLPRANYDMANPAHGLYPQHGLPQVTAAPPSHQGGYAPFVPRDGRNLSASALKLESMGRGQM